MRIAWFSDAPWVPSGFGSQTALLLPLLRELGHEIAVIQTTGLTHGVAEWRGFPVFPAGNAPWNADMLPTFAGAMKADITIGFIDPWVLQPAIIKACPRFVSLYPVDHDPLPKCCIPPLTAAWDRIAYSKFGVSKTEEAGLTCHYAPHGFDGSVYYPMDKSEARAALELPDDGRFVVGVVAANNDPLPARKSWAQIIEGFKLFYDAVGGDALLYLHAPILGQVNIGDIIEFYGVPSEAIRVCNQGHQRIGFPPEHMRQTYNAMDVLLAPSMGEGFGLPIIEAQACNVPVIVGGWTAMPELVRFGISIDKEYATSVLTHLISNQWLPSIDSISQGIEFIRNLLATDQEFNPAGKRFVQEYEIRRVVETYWQPILSRFQARIVAEELAEKVEAIK